MYYYKVYGLKVESDLVFPQLVRCEESTVSDVQIMKAELSQEIQANWPKKKYVFGRDYSWLINRTCQIQVYEGKRITYALQEGGKADYLQTYLLGYGMSMLALQRNMLPMHCSVVADEEGAVMIAGESGVGKSTITTSFLNNGYYLMADDMAFVDGTNVYPAFPYQKLCRDVVIREGLNPEELIYIDEDKDKFLAPVKGKFDVNKRPVKGFIYLHICEGQEVITNELVGLERFHVYASNLFLRKLLGNQKYEAYIGSICLEMASKVPLYAMGRPNGRDTTDEVVSKAMEWVQKL